MRLIAAVVCALLLVHPVVGASRHPLDPVSSAAGAALASSVSTPSPTAPASLTAFASPGPVLRASTSGTATPSHQPPTALEARLAVEELRYRHRIWPAENPGPKPAFPREQVAARLEERLEDEARRARALDEIWGVRLSAADLRTELERMARDTRDPERLRETWGALGNDPGLIARTMAKPALVERRIRERFSADPISAGAARGDAFETWWTAAGRRFSAGAETPVAGLSLPAITAAACTPDTWSAITSGAPEARAGHTMVWTGSEVIVWGGVEGEFLNTGARYDPATDTWRPMTTTGAPTGRHEHTAIWTGTEMIVYGGRDASGSVEDGARYNPASDSWTPMAMLPGAAGQRTAHTAVWTGTEMIIWGGVNKAVFSPFTYGDGSRYRPSTDSWAVTSSIGAPTARYSHTAVWTGSEMIVWGGVKEARPAITYTNTGARYDPATNTWSSLRTTGAPVARAGHNAVWTGSRMIVWGGSDNGTTGSFAFNSGASYDPGHDRWTTISATNAPVPRLGATAVWTGARMVVWGGDLQSGATASGGRYDPAGDVWTGTSSTGAPAARGEHAAVWTGSRMVVFGGRLDGGETFASGGRYDPIADSWTPTKGSDVFRPLARSAHIAVWTGSEMVVWGGLRGVTAIALGARYDPATDLWTPLNAAGEPLARHDATALWTGSGLIVWGGENSAESPAQLRTGGIYDPALDLWSPTQTAGAPTGRSLHRAVWSGSEMDVWGGVDDSGGYVNTGGRYDPSTGAWSAITTVGAPDPRAQQAQVWDGKEMIVWGGNGFLCCHVPSSGGRYDPVADAWTPTTLTKAPEDRARAAAVWSGDHLVVWGGVNPDGGLLGTGGRHDPFEDTWTGVADAPITARRDFASTWLCGAEWIWGGQDTAGPANMSRQGAFYDPAADTWTDSGTIGAPFGRTLHTAVTAGPRAIVFGGRGAFDDSATGGVYCGCATTPVPAGVVQLRISPSPTGSRLSWAAAAAATGYDVTRGVLSTLHATGGDFAASTTGCVADNLSRTWIDDAAFPPPGDGFWYLVRAVDESGGGTYDSGDQSQVGSRDAGIAASGAGCP